MARKAPTPSPRTKQRFKDLKAAQIPLWKIEKILGLSEHLLRLHYPDVFENIPTPAAPPRWEPSPEQIRQIELMAGMGIPQKKIALVVGVGYTTLVQACGNTMARASTLMDMKVGANIFRMATGDPNAKNTALAAIWWSKSRMGWQEPQKVEHVGLGGGPIQTQTQIQIVLPDNGRDDRQDKTDTTIEGDGEEDGEDNLLIEGQSEEEAEYDADNDK